MREFVFGNEYSYNGDWSLDIGGDTTPGKFMYDGDSITLEIYTTGDKPLFFTNTVNIVFGTIDDGSKITLYDVIETNQSWSTRGDGQAQLASFRVSKCVKGGWFDETPKYKKCSFPVPRLDAWIDRTSITLDRPANPANLNPSISVTWGENAECYVTSIKAKIKFYMSYKSGSTMDKGFYFKPLVYVVITPDSEQDSDWFLWQINVIRKFIGVLTEVDFFVNQQIGIFADDSQTQYLLSGYPTNYPSVKNSYDFLITFEEISTKLDFYLGNL